MFCCCQVLVIFAIFAKFADFQRTFFTFPFYKSELLLDLLIFLFLRYLLAFGEVVVVIATKNYYIFMLVFRFLRNLSTIPFAFQVYSFVTLLFLQFVR